MNKKTKWGIIILVGAGIIGGGIYSQLPKKNDELAAADKVMGGNQKKGKQILNVNAKVIKPQLLTDEFTTTGVLLPDEEVDLSFETSGKIVEINFEEGTSVKKGQLLAKVNDRQLQAQLQRLVYLFSLFHNSHNLLSEKTSFSSFYLEYRIASQLFRCPVCKCQKYNTYNRFENAHRSRQ